MDESATAYSHSPPAGRLALGLLLALGACTPQPPDKVEARVNGEPILTREVDLALQHLPTAPAEQNRRGQVLRHLVIAELLAQQVRRTTPDSAALADTAANTARREVLARRYVEHLEQGVAAPRAAEIRAYYRTHPELFAERHVFDLRAVAIHVGPERADELRQGVRLAASLDDLIRWLRQQKLPFTVSETARSSDELSPVHLDQLRAMKDGQTAAAFGDEGFLLIQRMGVRQAPLDERSAWPQIARRLHTEMQLAAVNAEVQRLTRTAAIFGAGGATRQVVHPLRREIGTPPPGASHAARGASAARGSASTD
jgi:EpsD family peptidyl-prolyl cis-trans isomerase